MLLNVRLGPEEERVVKGLRRAKVNVSALVRKAIREAAPKEGRKQSLGDAMDQIIAQYPSDDSPREKRPPLDDRRAMAAYIRQRIARKLKRAR
jgi:hypothetical protein